MTWQKFWGGFWGGQSDCRGGNGHPSHPFKSTHGWEMINAILSHPLSYIMWLYVRRCSSGFWAEDLNKYLQNGVKHAQTHSCLSLSPFRISISFPLAATMTQAAVITIFFVLGVFPKGKRDVTVVCTFTEVFFSAEIESTMEDSCVLSNPK